MIITDNIQDVADFVRELDIVELENILTQQILSQDIVSAFEKDNFMPLYSQYRQVMKDNDVDEDYKKMTKERFYQICVTFAESVSKKFELSYDADYYADHRNDFMGVAFSMYRFFILDLFEHVKGVAKEYIEEHLDDLADMFEDLKNKRDAATISNKKYVPLDYHVVVSNMPDAISWALSQMSEEMFLDYCDKEDAVVENINTLYENGRLSGQFMSVLIDMYRDNVEFRSKLVFDLTFSLDFGKCNVKTEEF